MLHPVDYRLAKNKFWLSTWNSYSLKNYRNLILNDKILNVLGKIFSNCFKVTFSVAAPWTNFRKFRKYSQYVIGFDGRRAIRLGPNKIKKLPNFIIPEDYNIIRFFNFSILKIFFLIDQNLNHWLVRQKKWRIPISYFNLRYSSQKKKKYSSFFWKNLFKSSLEKKNFKSTNYFLYLTNFLNHRHIKRLDYFDNLDLDFLTELFKKNKKSIFFYFFYNNFKLLNKIRNNYFFFFIKNFISSNFYSFNLRNNNQKFISISLLNKKYLINLFLNNLNYRKNDNSIKKNNKLYLKKIFKLNSKFFLNTKLKFKFNNFFFMLKKKNLNFKIKKKNLNFKIKKKIKFLNDFLKFKFNKKFKKYRYQRNSFLHGSVLTKRIKNININNLICYLNINKNSRQKRKNLFFLKYFFFNRTGFKKIISFNNLLRQKVLFFKKKKYSKINKIIELNNVLSKKLMYKKNVKFFFKKKKSFFFRLFLNNKKIKYRFKLLNFNCIKKKLITNRNNNLVDKKKSKVFFFINKRAYYNRNFHYWKKWNKRSLEFRKRFKNRKIKYIPFKEFSVLKNSKKKFLKKKYFLVFRKKKIYLNAKFFHSLPKKTKFKIKKKNFVVFKKNLFYRLWWSYDRIRNRQNKNLNLNYLIWSKLEFSNFIYDLKKNYKNINNFWKNYFFFWNNKKYLLNLFRILKKLTNKSLFYSNRNDGNSFQGWKFLYKQKLLNNNNTKKKLFGKSYFKKKQNKNVILIKNQKYFFNFATRSRAFLNLNNHIFYTSSFYRRSISLFLNPIKYKSIINQKNTNLNFLKFTKLLLFIVKFKQLKKFDFSKVFFKKRVYKKKFNNKFFTFNKVSLKHGYFKNSLSIFYNYSNFSQIKKIITYSKKLFFIKKDLLKKYLYLYNKKKQIKKNKFSKLFLQKKHMYYYNLFKYHNFKKYFTTINNRVTLLKSNSFKNTNYKFSFVQKTNKIFFFNSFFYNKKLLKRINLSSILKLVYIKFFRFSAKGFNKFINNNISISNTLVFDSIFLNKRVKKFKLYSNYLNLFLLNNKNKLLKNNNILFYKNFNFKEKSEKKNKIKNFIFNWKNLINFHFKYKFSKHFQNHDKYGSWDKYWTNETINDWKVYSKIPNKRFIRFKPYSLRGVSKIHRYNFYKMNLSYIIRSFLPSPIIFKYYKKFAAKKKLLNKFLGKPKDQLKWKRDMFKIRTYLLRDFLIKNNKVSLNLLTIKSIRIFNEYFGLVKSHHKKVQEISDPLEEFKKWLKNHVKNTLVKKYNFELFIDRGIKKLQLKYFTYDKDFHNKMVFKQNLLIKQNLLNKTNKKIILKNFLNFSTLLPKLSKLQNAYCKSHFDFSNYKSTLKFYTKFNFKFFISIQKYADQKSKFFSSFKILKQKYSLNNKVFDLNCLIVKSKSKQKKFNKFIKFFFKKNFNNKSNLSIFSFTNKSKNLYWNKYTPKRLSDVFISLESMVEFKKLNIQEISDLDYRGYGLGKKLRSRRINYKLKKERVLKLKPNTIFYWNHLKWFNIFIKNHGYSKFYLDKFYFLKNYEKFKKINFKYLFKLGKHNGLNYFKNSTFFLSNYKNNYSALKRLVYYISFFKSKSIYLNNHIINNDIKYTIFNKWSHSVKFSIIRSKRLQYVPYKRYKKIKDNIFMWRVCVRKLSKLKRFFFKKTKIYKKKLKFSKNKKFKKSIVNFLKLMKANFNLYKRKSHQELPIFGFLKKIKSRFKKINKFIISYLKLKNFKLFLKKNDFNKLNSQLLTDKQLFIRKLFLKSKKINFERTNLIKYVKKFVEHLFFIIFKFNNLRIFYIKVYKMNIMGTKAKLFKNLFNYRLATGFKVPFLIKIICKKLNYDKSMVGCKIGFFGRYSRKLRNRKIWRFIRHIKPSIINTPLDYYNVIILQKWGITGIKLSMLRKKVFNFVFN